MFDKNCDNKTKTLNKKKDGIVIITVVLIVSAIIAVGISRYFIVFSDVDETSTTNHTTTTKREYLKKYDDKGNLIEEEVGSPGGYSGVLRYEYDSDGNKIKVKYYDDDGKSNWSRTYKYDTSGNMINQTGYNGNGIINDSHDFDSDGNEVKTTYYDPDGTMNSIYTYEYDTEGNITKEAYYDSNETLVHITEHLGPEQSKTTQYYENGKVKSVTVGFHSDVLSYTSYDEDGNIIEQY